MQHHQLENFNASEINFAFSDALRSWIDQLNAECRERFGAILRNSRYMIALVWRLTEPPSSELSNPSYVIVEPQNSVFATTYF